MTRCPGAQPAGRGPGRFDDPDDLVAGSVGQRDKGVTPAGGVQVGSADAGHQCADQGLVRAGDGNVGRLDRDLAWIDDDSSHAGHGAFRCGTGGSWPGWAGAAYWSRSVKVFRTPRSSRELRIER